MKEQVQKIIDKVQPYIQMHGGGVELVDITDGIVKLKISGACAHCRLSDQTFNHMLGGMIKEEVPGFKGLEIQN